MKLHTLVLAVSALLACPVAGAAEPMPPYAGGNGRSIRSLSPDRIEGLVAGKGLGYAKPRSSTATPARCTCLNWLMRWS
ncbi:hypothetical protein [Stenotrophomonas sp. Marseille-Q4652]|uniref:hypothetical protein n=1 Tax=Stenotrophomonas sp. Marseille-Q4652 TaxID=2866595 RepID=UPI001CE3B5FC|nr:hypothetical protein [Stenotrophomonas sp. Marseille-Q4652]